MTNKNKSFATKDLPPPDGVMSFEFRLFSPVPQSGQADSGGWYGSDP
jgi:hypothetical protein